jgi:hypothetical protein
MILAYYGLMRLVRQRKAAVALLVLPIVAGLALRERVWLGPVIFALAAVGVVWLMQSADRASGLAAAIRCTPVAASRIVWSWVLMGAVVFAGQMAVFGAILAILG